MATKAKTRAVRNEQRKSSLSQAVNPKQESNEATQNVFDLLEQDHRQVEEWLDEYDELEGNGRRKGELAKEICQALTVHTEIEEEIFYPAARDATKDNDLIDEAVVEHATVKHMIAEIEKMKPGDELYDAKMRVLGEMVKRHIREEEEELFPELQSAKMDLDAIGKKLADRKQQLMTKMHA
jgi:hemerythrin superfamily protein